MFTFVFSLYFCSGETSANKAQIIQGHSNTELSDYGRKQILNLANHFNKEQIKFDKIYSSDLKRAFDTAKILIGSEKDVIVDLRLRERAYGVNEGKTLEQFRSEARKSGLKEKDLSFYTPPGGELLSEVYKRVKDFLINQLVKTASNNDKVLIVTHGGVIREFMRYFRDELNCDFKGHEIMRVTPNTALNTFQVSIGLNQKIRVECIKIHYTPHLTELSDRDKSNSVTFQAL